VLPTTNLLLDRRVEIGVAAGLTDDGADGLAGLLGDAGDPGDPCEKEIAGGASVSTSRLLRRSSGAPKRAMNASSTRFCFVSQRR
jgi:hypothetical protein